MENYSEVSQGTNLDFSNTQSHKQLKDMENYGEHVNVRTRAPLGSLTNRPICRHRTGKSSLPEYNHPVPSKSNKPLQCQVLLASTNETKCDNENSATVNECSACRGRENSCSCVHSYVHSKVTRECGIAHTEHLRTNFVGELAGNSCLNVYVCKRLRQECLTKVSSLSHPSGGLPRSSPIDESEIDRRPFVSKLACDIVRAAFADRVQLEHFLMECRQSDFAISALDRSPGDRMLEATDYIVGIMAYEQIRERKECFRVPDFLKCCKQPNLTADMLTTLADWLVEVQEIFSFNHETIHLAWGILYAYFARGRPLARREIQLMACAALMVSCKHEESRMPRLTEFLYITDGAYKREDFIEAERQLLVAIDFAVHRPNPYMFLRRYARVLDAQSGLVQYMSRFLLEAGMHSHVISLKRESRKAAAVLWLARVVLRNPSYMEWAHRADVRQLRKLIRSNPVVRHFYENCPRAELKRPAFFQNQFAICPDSGAMDLSNCSTSSALSRSASITPCVSMLSTESNSNWACSDAIERPTPVDRVSSEPHSRRMDDSPSNHNGWTSAPSELQAACATLDASLRAELEAMRSEEDQRAPYWPPILEHITGYKETDLIPLATRYHTIAMRLIAEVARGSRLAKRTSVACRHDASFAESKSPLEDEATDTESSNSAHQRCVSPGGHYLRRQSVSKYCSDTFLHVADAYPQLAFENFVPYFPSVQCPDSCECFTCVNLIRPIV